MKAGPDLDMLVVVKVMGWIKAFYGGPGGTVVWVDPELIIEKKDEGEVEVQVDQIKAIPSYSTSIEAAWEVVEKMRSAGYGFEICHRPGLNLVVGFEADHHMVSGHWATDEIPLAICRAALNAKGVEIPA